MNKTNIEQQYDEIKANNPSDYLIFFQMGDFFELFNDDAIKIHEATGITLTKRGNRPMAGIPCKTALFYARKLVFEHDYTIALCEQVIGDSNGKIMQRKITKILTKGTIFDELYHDYNFVLSIYINNNTAYISYGDASTNEIFVQNMNIVDISSFIYQIKPVYIITNKDIEINLKYEINLINQHFTSNIVLNQYEQHSYNALMYYFDSKGCKFTPFVYKENTKYMYIHANTLKNIEVFNDINHNNKNSLFEILNKTNTPMGYRLLKKHLQFPSIDIHYLQNNLVNLSKYIEYIQKGFKLIFNIGDITRNLTSVNNLISIKRLAYNIQNSKKLLLKCYKENLIPEYLMNMYDISININTDDYILNILQCDNFTNILSIQDLNEKKNNLIKKMEEFVIQLNINAKYERNTLLGSFFKTSQIINNDTFIPIKGLKDTYRYTHNILIQYENEIKLLDIEVENIINNIIQELIKYINENKKDILILSIIISEIDVLYSKALVAIEYELTAPIFDNEINITNGYNLIIHKLNKICIKNDLLLSNNRAMLLAGVNMGGKSTYLKQNATIVLMAQAGMYVPAQKAILPIITGLFVRMGAHDDIFNNSSTFFIEMQECSMFLKKITDKSLIILDEVGRGTSYLEGMSISQALSEYIKKINAYSIISTHYLELYKVLSNFIHKQVSYKLHNDKLIFLYKIIDGNARSSLGIYTAKLAGINNDICDRANEILEYNIKNIH